MQKLLVANRGEIARRIFRTARRMGIQTVAVFSDADQNAPFRREADEAIYIGPSEATSSYLNVEQLLGAIRKSGADAVHPGYGFLSESPQFAEAVVATGARFIGPKPATIKLLGDKVESRLLAERLKIPTVPGLHLDSEVLSADQLKEVADKLRFPLIVKAAGGGGGRGMRVVEDKADLPSALARASAEAKSFFNNAQVFLEHYVRGARHVEVQFLADTHGNILVLSERDCSLQRSHQKIIEEAPATVLTEPQRQALHQAARALAGETGYENAGTAEFLVAPDGEYYFLEVNSRLQVEHPVTESVLGLDLVEAQLLVADGADLNALQLGGLETTGHAIELRICAESPFRDFQASTGAVEIYNLPQLTASHGARLDSGIEKSSTISHFYDSLVAKVVVHAPSRLEAVSKATALLKSVAIGPMETNCGLLLSLLSSREFQSNTHSLQTLPLVLERYRSETYDPQLAAHLASCFEAASSSSFNSALAGFRLCGQGERREQRAVNGELIDYTFTAAPSRSGTLSSCTRSNDREILTELVRVEGPELVFRRGDQLLRALVHQDKNESVVNLQGTTYCVQRELLKVPGKHSAASLHSRDIKSPLPGKIIEVCVSSGTAVEPDTVVLRLESMKMEHPVKSGATGILSELKVKPGDPVVAGQLLARVED